MLLNIDHINKPDLLPELLLILIFLLSSGNCLPNIGDGKNERTEKQEQVQSRVSQPAETEAKRANGTSNTKDV